MLRISGRHVPHLVPARSDWPISSAFVALRDEIASWIAATPTPKQATISNAGRRAISAALAPISPLVPMARTPGATWFTFQDVAIIKQANDELAQGASFRSVAKALMAAQSGQLSFDFRIEAEPARVITLDTHNDIEPDNFTATKNYSQRLDTQVNLPKMKEGRMDVSFMIVYVGQSTPPQVPDAVAKARRHAPATRRCRFSKAEPHRWCGAFRNAVSRTASRSAWLP